MNNIMIQGQKRRDKKFKRDYRGKKKGKTERT
jgi:hypothetical protein